MGYLWDSVEETAVGITEGERTRNLEVKKQEFHAEFRGDHKSIDDFTWKESWISSEVAKTCIDGEPQTELL